MKPHRIFNLLIIISFTFSLLGMPLSALAQEPQSNSELNMIEYQIPSNHKGSVITVAPDGNAWFTEWESPWFGRVTTDGTVTEFYNGCNSGDIIVGPDGNIWFAGVLYGGPPGGWLGTISPDAPEGSEPTKYFDPTGDQFTPLYLTVGPDGNIWYTDGGSNKIVKFVLSDQSFTIYEIAGAGSPHGITSGPDGNLWIANYGGGSILKVTTGGDATHYYLPNYYAGAYDIVAGPDGNLWFVELSAPNVGQITPDGTITEYPFSSNDPSGYQATSIAVGSDGNLWFTETWNDKIGRITPSGELTEYPMPVGSHPAFIASSPDGSLWVTEMNFPKIARIFINQPPVITSINAPVAPVQLGQSIDATVIFSDPDSGDTHNIRWDWGDGLMITLPATVPSVKTAHTYTSPGVYTITATITDAAGASASNTFQYVVIYDPTGGYVTGGGWIDSPAGAFTADLSLAGKATFGFVSKYQKGATAPTGSTEFQFHVAGLDFKSTSYEWLVVAGLKAQYKGTGSVNGVGSYSFLLSAVDGTPDKFRIKIWDKADGNVIYDNMLGAEDTATPTTTLGGGSIVIHK